MKTLFTFFQWKLIRIYLQIKLNNTIKHATSCARSVSVPVQIVVQFNKKYPCQCCRSQASKFLFEQNSRSSICKYSRVCNLHIYFCLLRATKDEILYMVTCMKILKNSDWILSCQIHVKAKDGKLQTLFASLKIIRKF